MLLNNEIFYKIIFILLLIIYLDKSKHFLKWIIEDSKLSNYKSLLLLTFFISIFEILIFKLFVMLELSVFLH